MCESGVKMAVEAAANRLEALVEKIDSDLNYAVLKLENEFSESFKDDLPSDLNPVGLIERLQKAKETFKMLIKENEEIETKQKAISQELCKLTPEQMSKVCELQLQTGMKPTIAMRKEYPIPQEESDAKENVNNFQALGVGNNVNFYNGKYSMSQSASSDFQPVTEEEFLSVSDLVRGRSKLEDVNQVYNALFSYFQKNRKASCLTLKAMVKLGLKVSGATGNAKLKVLKTLNIIEMDKDGSVKML